MRKYQPISIWDYSTGVFNYNIEVSHDAVNSEDEAKKIANYEFDKVGIFINKDALPERKLMVGAITTDGEIKRLFKNNVKILILKPQVAERLSAPIPMDSEENKAKAVDALMSMDESYMVSDDDYMEFSLPLDRIENSIRVTPEKPLFFDSIAYKIVPR